MSDQTFPLAKLLGDEKQAPPTEKPMTAPGHIVIGPSKSGKTWLLAALEVAATLNNKQARSEERERYDVFPDNEEMRELTENARRIGETGELNHIHGTGTVTRYKLKIREKSRASSGPMSIADHLMPVGSVAPNEQWHPFEIVDGKGGDIFGAADVGARKAVSKTGDDVQVQSTRTELIDAAKHSSGLIICADVSNAGSAQDFFLRFTGFLGRVAVPNNVLPFDRVAIVLTKADQIVKDEEHNALKTLQGLDPWPYAEKVLGPTALSDLVRYLRPDARPAIYCGWASVYGFVPNDGCVNYKIEDGVEKLRVYSKNPNGNGPANPQFINDWRPFRLLDPFIFVATGRKMNLQPIPEALIES